ncbi:hypothetical protein PRIPAC_88924, partial [Pristionchus pacificus]|uniref:Uncharacterized protein n=1 Tax=Pristionchus pacificus TaxID=54126 RepID=A0A2A6B952_PRIPA
MSSTGAEKMNLNNLPSDVVRIIIGMEPEAMESMRVVTGTDSSWTISKHANSAQVCPCSVSLIGESLHVSPKEAQNYAYNYAKRTCNFSGSIGAFAIVIRFGSTQLETRIRTVQRAFRYSSSLEDRVALLLSRCSRIEHLKLAMDIFDHELPLKVVRHAMRHLTVGTLTLSGLQSIDQPLANLILDIIRNKNNSLKCLIMKEDEDCNIIME